MKTYELSERDIIDLWKLARVGDHPDPGMVTDKLKELGFGTRFVNNGHGGFVSLQRPVYFNKKNILFEFVTLLSNIGVFTKFGDKKCQEFNQKFANIRI